jgi:hypothetical protein
VPHHQVARGPRRVGALRGHEEGAEQHRLAVLGLVVHEALGVLRVEDVVVGRQLPVQVVVPGAAGTAGRAVAGGDRVGGVGVGGQRGGDLGPQVVGRGLLVGGGRVVALVVGRQLRVLVAGVALPGGAAAPGPSGPAAGAVLPGRGVVALVAGVVAVTRVVGVVGGGRRRAVVGGAGGVAVLGVGVGHGAADERTHGADGRHDRDHPSDPHAVTPHHPDYGRMRPG